MDFSLSIAQTQLQVRARGLFEDKLPPALIREIEQSETGFSHAIWDAGVQLGWPGIALPEAFGGSGRSLLDMCVLVEELGRGGAALPLVDSAGVSATILQHSPAGEQRDRCLSDIASGKIIVPALTDEQGRNEWDDIRLPISDDQGDGFRLSGTKAFVPYATVTHELLVTATTSDGVTTLVVVDPATEGISMTRHHTDIGIPMFSVTFKDVRVSADKVIHQGEGAEAALHAGLNTGTILAIAEAVGQCEALLKLSSEYVKVREAFGRPIGAFQAVAHACADIHIHTETVRILLHDAAWAVGKGDDALEEIHSTKALANELFAEVANNSFRVHGALGMSSEYDLEIYIRRLQGFFQTLGETEDSFERAAMALAGL